MAHYFPLVGDHGAGLPPLHPLVFQPPPPPPPRSATNSSRRTSSFDGSTGPFDRMLMAGPAHNTNQSQHTYERPRSSSAMSSHSQDADGEAQKCGRCGDMQEAMQRLEAKLALHITRVEMESQSALKAVIAEVNKLKQDREAAWKHVAELKEQNRLIRQRAFELEKQNGQFTMHIATLQERLCAFTEVAGQLQMLQGAAPPVSNSLMPSMPKVPHSGADIW